MLDKRFLCLVLLLWSVVIIGQTITVSPGEISPNQSRTDIISQLSLKKNITISYSSSQFENSIVKSLPQVALSLEKFLFEIFDDYAISLNKINEEKYVLSMHAINISISGYITSTEGESLAGATIVNTKSGTATTSDEKGFYYIESRPGEIILEIIYVGHNHLQFKDNRRKSFFQNFKLENTSILPIFIKQEKQLTDPLTEIPPNNNTITKNTTLGDKDPLAILMTVPGVAPRGEASTGLSVRGGSPDQNLVLLEGMPIYETNHTGNLTSIFIDESIRNVDFMKSGLPARYGGRLNSVINIYLKDGNNAQRSTKINTSLQAITFFTQGPISKEKISYAATFRQSWVNNLLSPFKSKIKIYNDFNLGYNDAQIKLTYKIKSTQKLSVSFYQGRDLMELSKNTSTQSGVNVNSTNSFSSNNSLLSINYDHLLSNKLKLHIQAGLLSYKVISHGQYNYLSSIEDTLTSYLDVINKTTILDKQMVGNMDYYINEQSKIKFGIGYVHHQYNPAVKESIAKIDDVEEIWGGIDSSIVANEFYSYIEGNFKFKNLVIVPGLYGVNYFSDGIAIPSLQPRLQIYYTPWSRIQLQGSYTNAVQYIHLLNNSGLGLPSELWVPSTKLIPAQRVQYWSGALKLELSNQLKLSGATYYKNFTNAIDYSEPVDNLLNVINPANITPIFNSQRDWERKTEVGDAIAYGYEAGIHHNASQWQNWVSYHYGRAQRRFRNIDNGQVFNSKYDKPHNISIGSTYVHGSWQFGLSWVYTSGQPFTIADELFLSPLDQSLIGIKLIKPSGRNNYRMPAFHQLSCNIGHEMKIGGIHSHINFGVYNVYNRFNAFYIYSIQDNDKIKFYKVSIFPILPQLNISFTW